MRRQNAGDEPVARDHVLTKRQIGDEAADEAMADVVVARRFPCFEVVGVLWTRGSGREMFRRVVALVADCVRDTVAVTHAEPLLEREVEPAIA